MGTAIKDLEGSEEKMKEELTSEKLCSIFPKLTIEMAQLLLPFIQIKQIKKHTFFIAKGDIPSEFAFCFSGLFRYYYIDYQGVEYTKHFAKDGNLIISYSAMIRQEESKFYIEALENSVVGTINYKKYQECRTQSPLLKNFEFEMMLEIYCLKEYRESQLLTKSPKERYLDFIREDNTLIGRVKQHQIASYIGVSPVTLSRLKNSKNDIK